MSFKGKFLVGIALLITFCNASFIGTALLSNRLFKAWYQSVDAENNYLQIKFANCYKEGVSRAGRGEKFDKQDTTNPCWTEYDTRVKAQMRKLEKANLPWFVRFEVWKRKTLIG